MPKEFLDQRGEGSSRQNMRHEFHMQLRKSVQQLRGTPYARQEKFSQDRRQIQIQKVRISARRKSRISLPKHAQFFRRNNPVKTRQQNNSPIYPIRLIKLERNSPAMVIILPKPTADVAVQTETSPKIRRRSKPKSPKDQICRQTQTNHAPREKQTKKSAETQTAKTVPRVIRVRQRKNISIVNEANISLTSEYILPDSPLSLRHDVILQDLWEEKSSSGTQTSPEKNLFGDLDEYPYHRGISRSDPMLTEETHSNKYSSIETQTEKAYCRSIFESDPLSSNNETQTPEMNIYSNTCTQTCDDILSSSDLVLSDIQTQTAWSHMDESTVSAETQTKALKCLYGCGDSSSWFTTQTNHMETQTDLLHIFEDLA